MPGKVSCLRVLFVSEKTITLNVQDEIYNIILLRETISRVQYVQFILLQPFLITDYMKIAFQEAFGRYLDMHELYHQYVNSKFGEPIEYSAYLDVFSETDKIPRKMKTTRQVVFSIHLICLII